MTSRRRDLGLIVGFALLIAVLSAGKAYTIDETWFLALARGALADPLKPEAIRVNFYGATAPLGDFQLSPMCICYPMALGLRLVGEDEWRLRLFFLPFDLVAAAFLYLIAERYLKKPLLPTLIVMASPAYLINMPHLMAEKFMAAAIFPAVYLLAAGIEDDRPGCYWGSAALSSLALAVKPSSLFVVLLGLAYSAYKKVSLRRMAGWALLSGAPFALYFLWSRSHAGKGLDLLWTRLASPMQLSGGDRVQRLRALLTFTAGSAGAACLWAWLGDRRRGWLSLAGAAVLFLPFLDAGPVRAMDRALGLLMAACALRCLLAFTESRPSASPARALWAAWLGIVLVLQATLYHTGVVARFILFGLPPLVFFLAAEWEARGAALSLKATFVATLLLSLALLRVDCRYAGAQRDIAQLARREYLDRGRRVFFAGHWGLQYYMERAGAVALDRGRGAWEEPRAGDVVVVPSINTLVLRPRRPIYADIRRVVVDGPLPLRLMSEGTSEAGFYSSAWGFLPFTISREPLERFSLLEIR